MIHISKVISCLNVIFKLLKLRTLRMNSKEVQSDNIPQTTTQFTSNSPAENWWLQPYINSNLPIYNFNNSDLHEDQINTNSKSNDSSIKTHTKSNIIYVYDFDKNLITTCNDVNELREWFSKHKFSGTFWDAKVNFTTKPIL